MANSTSTGDGAALDSFDRLMGNMHGRPDVTTVKAATVRAITPLIGASELYIVQTYRVKDEGDTIFLEAVGKAGTVRLALPPAVADAIARQRDALASKARSKAAKATMQARMERGEVPGFLKGKKGK